MHFCAFIHAVITAVVNAGFGKGTGPVFLDDIKCRGNETNILSCPQLPKDTTHNCRHSEDAGVQCQGIDSRECHVTLQSSAHC